MSLRRFETRTWTYACRVAGFAWLTISRHYVSMTSAAVIVFLFALAMTSDSFVSRDSAREARNTTASAASSAPPRQRNAVVFFVVEDQTQLRAISEAFADDQEARAGGPYHADHVVFLLAGTQEEEAATIARINFEVAIAGPNVDLKVVDVRGRFAR